MSDPSPAAGLSLTLERERPRNFTVRRFRTQRESEPADTATDAPSPQPDVAAAPPVCDTAPDETLLAWVRLGGAAAVLFTLLTDHGPGHSRAVAILVGAYVAYALVVLVLSDRQPRWLARHVVLAHVLDFTWTAMASTISGGTGSHVFSFFAFVLAAAAFRWGLERAFQNALLVLAVGVAQTVAAATGVTPWAVEFDHFLLQVSYITSGMAVLFGILADRLHRARYQAATITRLVNSVTRARSIRDGLANTLVGVAEALEAARVVVVAEDTYTGRIVVWNAVTLGKRIVTTDDDVPRDRAAEWMWGGSHSSACEFRRRGPQAEPVLCFSREGKTAIECRGTLPAGVDSTPDWRRILVFPFSASGAWNGYLYVMDPAKRPHGEARLRFVGDIVRQVTPALLNLYLQRRLRWRAESVERSRISRELHDTANQSLAAISMRLELLGREMSERPSRLIEELRDLQSLVREVDLDLRESVAQPHFDLDSTRLPAVLGELVDRFSRQSGIEARLEWNVVHLQLPPQHCSELARIVQEALFNVRRHSGASRVVVRVEQSARRWSVIIEDNGRGLGFTGRLSGDEPEMQRRAPKVIRERARVLGGSMAIESSSGGTRLEMTFPEARAVMP